MNYLRVGECLYSMCGTVIISVTVPFVEEFITVVEVIQIVPYTQIEKHV